MTCVILLDNGSIRPAATLRLRVMASKLSERVLTEVHPVSLAHANKIDGGELNNISAEILPEFLNRQLAAGIKKFVILPLYFGMSKAVTTAIPALFQRLLTDHASIEFTMADVLYPLPSGEIFLAKILHEHIIQTAKLNQTALKNIVLVDHGSPTQAVTRVRMHLSEQLQRSLGDDVLVEQAVMERRAGKAFDFNGVRLEEWLLSEAKQKQNSVIVALLFSLPGRHAGKGGDIERICKRVMYQHPDFKIATTPLVSDHDALIEILINRLQTVMPS